MPTKQQIKELNQHFALEDDASAIEMLYGDEVNSFEKDGEGRSVIHYVAEYGRIELFEGVVPDLCLDVNAQDNRGRTPLHVAALGGHAEMCLFIIKNWNEVNPNAQDEKGWTPLHLASQMGHDAVVKELLSDATLGVNPLLQDLSAKTALDVAATPRCRKILYLRTPSGFNTRAVMEPDDTKLKSRFGTCSFKLKSRFD